MVPTATAPLRVILYARVSIERDSKSKSVDDQLTELRRWAEREGWVVVAEYRDDGVSASRYAAGRSRPGWTSALDDVHSRRVDALLAWEFSRSTRDRSVWAALAAACQDTGTLIGTGGRLHDMDDPDDGFAMDLGAALAVRESAATSKRTLRAVESRAKAGRPAGSVPYGYRRVIDPHTGRTIGREIHPEQGAVVAEIVRRLLAHEPADAVAKDLNRRGVPTGTGTRWLGRHLASVVKAYPELPVSVEIRERLAAGETARTIAADLNTRGVDKPLPSRWAGGNLARLARRPTYAGLRVHRGAVLDDVRGTWPAIISTDDHHRLLALYRSPERDKFRQATHVRNLGVGIYRCGRDGCVGRMRIVVQAGRPSRYDCRRCHKISRYQEPVDALVSGWVVRFLSRDDVLAELGDGDDGTEEARAEVRRLEAKLAEIEAAVQRDEYPPAMGGRLAKATQDQLTIAERAARPRHVPAEVAAVAGPDAAARWERTGLRERRVIVDALAEVTILPSGRGGQPFDPTRIRIERRSPEM